MATDAAATHTVGSKVWVRDAEESWKKAEVVRIEDGLLVLKTEKGGDLKAKPEECPLQNPDTRGGAEVRSPIMSNIEHIFHGCLLCYVPSLGRSSAAGSKQAELKILIRHRLMHLTPFSQDMTTLPYLHEPGVLWNLKSRYMLDDIYTYTGSILIAVNPFASLPHLYGPHMMDQYRGADLGELSPHVYAIADAAYKQMMKEMKGQSILVRQA